MSQALGKEDTRSERKSHFDFDAAARRSSLVPAARSVSRSLQKANRTKCRSVAAFASFL